MLRRNGAGQETMESVRIVVVTYLLTCIIGPLHFQARDRRRRPNLVLGCIHVGLFYVIVQQFCLCSIILYLYVGLVFVFSLHLLVFILFSLYWPRDWLRRSSLR